MRLPIVITRLFTWGKAPPDIPPDWVSTTVSFHRFADLPHEKGSSVMSPDFICLGHEWCLELYPGGHEEAGEGEENISLFLHHQGDVSIKIGFSVNVRGSTRRSSFQHHRFVGDMGYGRTQFLKRDVALNI